MTAKKPAPKAPAKVPAKQAGPAIVVSDAAAFRAGQQLAAHLASDHAQLPVEEPGSAQLDYVPPTDAERIARDFARQAAHWLSLSSDPVRDVAAARAGMRLLSKTWPTVLRLSPQAFDDLRNHPLVIAYLAQVNLTRSLNLATHSHVQFALAPLFGLQRIDVSEECPSAELLVK